ncbi:uncharacterized protein [Dysidea avara]|uniref:uncharacterized protein isoform X3 n=1 Tax=Dysidea avara TaxID=196820 RepID=UPI00331EEE1E
MATNRLFSNGGNRAQYKWSSSQEIGHTSGTFIPVNKKIPSRHQCSYTAPLNGVIKHHPKLGNSANKYVYVNNSNKETMKVNNAKPVAELKGQIVHRRNSAHKNFSVVTNNKFHRSKNNVFRFTASPQPDKVVSMPVNTTCKDVSVKKPTLPVVNKITQPPIVKPTPVVLPDRNQLKWSSNDVKVPVTPPVNTKVQCKRSFSKTKFTWRRSSSGIGSSVPRHCSFSNMTTYISSKYKMQITSTPVQKKAASFTHGPRLNSAKKVVYMGGIAYNASSKKLSRRLSANSSKKFSAKRAAKRSGNKVWLAKPQAINLAEEENYTHPGYEIRPKGGNRQWIAAGDKSVLVRKANAIKHKYINRVTAPRRLSSSSSHKSKGLKSFRVFIKNEEFVMNARKNVLRRLSRTSLDGDSRRSVSLVPNRTSTHQLASHAVRRSRALVWHAQMKKNIPKSEQYCMFYNRFGKCTKQETCPYIHDPDKIAVCTRFLRGSCEKTDGSCPFSHHISKEKMPVCSFFLRGVCTKDDCPYLHVYVGKDAEICLDFAKGYCPNGTKCKKQHLLDCPEYMESGKCARGSKCPLRHKKKLVKRTHSSSTPIPSSKEPQAFKRRRIIKHKHNKANSIVTNSSSDMLITPDQLEFIPLEQGPSTPPEFIAL